MIRIHDCMASSYDLSSFQLLFPLLFWFSLLYFNFPHSPFSVSLVSIIFLCYPFYVYTICISIGSGVDVDVLWHVSR